MNDFHSGQNYPRRDNQQFSRRDSRPSGPDFDLKFGLDHISGWLKGKIDAEAISYSEKFGKYLKENYFTTAQIRKIFGEVKMLQQKGWDNDKTLTALLLLKPKLAYSAERIHKDCAYTFKDFLCAGIDIINKSENPSEVFQNFANLFEAILAYHRSYGGK
ncbi:MAG: type III-A CRISPR-associated protein Csm2 [archaeon]